MPYTIDISNPKLGNEMEFGLYQSKQIAAFKRYILDYIRCKPELAYISEVEANRFISSGLVPKEWLSSVQETQIEDLYNSIIKSAAFVIFWQSLFEIYKNASYRGVQATVLYLEIEELTANKISITVTDNGRGFPADFKRGQYCSSRSTLGVSRKAGEVGAKGGAHKGLLGAAASLENNNGMLYTSDHEWITDKGESKKSARLHFISDLQKCRADVTCAQIAMGTVTQSPPMSRVGSPATRKPPHGFMSAAQSKPLLGEDGAITGYIVGDRVTPVLKPFSLADAKKALSESSQASLLSREAGSPATMSVGSICTERLTPSPAQRLGLRGLTPSPVLSNSFGSTGSPYTPMRDAIMLPGSSLPMSDGDDGRAQDEITVITKGNGL